MKPLLCCFGLLAAGLAETDLPAGENRSAAPAVSAASALSFAETGQQLNRLAGRGVALADLNGDGFVDAFVVNASTPDGQGDRVYLGDGKGRFTDSGQELVDPANWEGKPALGDVNGDGKVDVVTGRTAWINDGRGHFQAHAELIEARGADLAGPIKLADLDGNGTLDLVAVSGWKSLGVYLNDGKGRFRDTGQQLGAGIIGSLAIGDVNGDGAADVISGGWRVEGSDYAPSRVWLNDGKGHFTDAGPVDHGENHVHGVALGDVNGDGSLDVVMACTTPGQAGKVYLNDGKGRFRDSGQILAHRWAHSVALGDFDGDGSLDAFFACGEPATGAPNEAWLNDGKGTFRDSGVRLGDAFSWDVALGDLNGDGKLDAVVSNLRIVDGSKSPPVFGGVPLEVWLNTTSRVAVDYLGQALRGSVPVVFARGVVSTDHLEHSSPAFSPDGSEVFWSLWRRPEKGEPQVIMTMRREGKTWSAPAVAPFSGHYVDGGPAFSVDGRRLYFSSADPAPPPPGGRRVSDICFVDKRQNGWSERKSLGLPASFPELQSVGGPSLTRNGTLYFRASSGIYRAELVSGAYAKPQLLPQSINVPGAEIWTPFIAPDDSYLLFASNRTGRLDGSCDLYISRHLADGGWTDPVSLGEPVNSDRQERFQMLSPDGKYLFFTRPTPGHDQDVYWVDAATIPVLRSMSNPRQEDPK